MAKFWRLRAKGDLSPDQVQAALPDGATHLLRVHKEADKTHVYFASASDNAPEFRGKGKRVEEVPLEAVTKIGS